MDHASLSCQDLVRACARTGSSEAWEAFIRRFDPVISATVYRTVQRWTQPSQSLIEDLKQEVFLKLCARDSNLLKSLAGTEGDGCFRLMKAATANLVTDHFKGLHARKRGSGKVEANLETIAAAGDSGGEDEMDFAILLGEIDAGLKVLGYAGGERTIYWLYYMQGFTAGNIARQATTELSEKGVESLLLRMNRDLRQWLAENRKGIGRASSS